MNRVCIFAGTSEGRELLEFLADFNIFITVCVATEYGEEILADIKNHDNSNIEIATGRMDQEQIAAFLKNGDFSLVIDCTHPYAQIASENIYNASCDVSCEYIRINRDSTGYKDCVLVEDTKQAVEYLASTTGNILLTTGAKELFLFKDCSFIDRVYARVLPLDSSIKCCKDINLPSKQIIAMQGPFSEDLNKAIFQSLDIKVMVTKDTGDKGGFNEKVQSASRLGITTVLIAKPEQKAGYSLETGKNIILDKLGIPQQNKDISSVSKDEKVIYVVGCGVGDVDVLTPQALEYLKNADVIIGASRLVEELSFLKNEKISEIYTDKILDIIKTSSHKKIAVAFTGDIGFCSGAKKLLENLTDMKVITASGISSPIYFSGKIHVPWEDMKLVSLHGKNTNIISAVRTNHKVFTLLGGENNVHYVCEKLLCYGFVDVDIFVGENLSYPQEKITKGTPQELLSKEFSNLACMVIINNRYNGKLNIGIDDDEFIRVSAVPMTKAEVRAVTIAKLNLEKDSVVYDVGAGTGSVSIEAALVSSEGTVYAIEKNNNAISAVKENMIKFKTDNINIVEGLAPECMSDLEAPTHVFIGGSSGNLKNIVDLALAKNKNARFVLNTVTLETLTEATGIIKDFANSDICEIASARSKKLGKYNLMTANNPVYIISFNN